MSIQKPAFLLLLLLSTLSVQAQDSYHTSLNNLLQTTYALPAAQQWVLPNTETATLAGSLNYGGSTTTFSPSGQPFTQGVRRTVTAGANPWDAGHLYKNTTAVAAGDRCLLVIWLRSDAANARVSLFAENGITYDKEVLATVPVGKEWKMIAAPFESTAAYAVNSLNIGLHLAFANQTIEIGGAACLNYKNTVFYSQLPVLLNNDTYPGHEPDAPWRATAAASIEQIRKADLTVRVFGSNNQPLAGAQVHVAMQQHVFKFGTAVVSNRFNGGSAFNATYEQKLLDLDGKGHGFNELVFENDLKWPAWEQGWFSSKPEIASDVQWLKNRGISVRGHNLAWPGWTYSPSDINATATPAFIKNRIRNHLTAILSYPGVGQEMIDWDVLNEITTNNDYANRFAGTPGYPTGRELYAEIFKQADSLAPNAVLYLNDYVAIEQGDSPTNGITLWKSRIDELLNAGAPVEGIGFQGHFSAAPTGIETIKSIYDDFWNTYGLEAKVTEFDLNKLLPAATQAAYLRDVLTITFAHPSMKGFLMWGFWDGAHWQGNAPLFNLDWSLKPSGAAFVDQVFHQWWTDETGATAADGQRTVRGFRGKYLVTVSCPDGSSQTREVLLDGDQTVDFQSACTVNAAEPDSGSFNLVCSPTVARDQVLLRWNNTGFSGKTTLRCIDAAGRVLAVYDLAPTENNRIIDTSLWPPGVYQIVMENEGRMQVVRVIVGR